MKLIVGLGNIGEKYLKNRHNVGFLFLDLIVEELKRKNQEIEWKEEKKLKSLIIKTKIQEEEYILAKPTTLMNLSGQAVIKLMNYFKIDKEDLMVIYDDIDLPLEKTRFREKGSAGTHNGMKSIIAELGSQEFKRLRIGIENRDEQTKAHQNLSSYVLSNFTKKEIEILEKIIKAEISNYNFLKGLTN